MPRGIESIRPKKAEGQRRIGEGLWNGEGEIDPAQLKIREAIAEEELRALRNWKIEARLPGVEKSLAGGASTGDSSLPAMSSNSAPFSWGFSTSPPDKSPAAVSASAPGTIRPFSVFPSIPASLASFPPLLSISAARNSTPVTSNVQPEVYTTTDKSHRWVSNKPQVESTDLTTRCGEIARTKERALNYRRYRVDILRKNSRYKRAGEEQKRKMEEKFAGMEEGEKFPPDISLLLRRMAGDFEDQDAEYRNKRARKQPFLNAQEEEDGSDTEDTIVVKFPGYGTENGEGGMKGFRERSGRNNAAIDNGKSVSQSTHKPNGKSTSKGIDLHKPRIAQPENERIYIPILQIIDLTLSDDEVIVPTSSLPANGKLESSSGNMKFRVEIPMKPQHTPGNSREGMKSFAQSKSINKPNHPGNTNPQNKGCSFIFPRMSFKLNT
ncbi:hypothetical protein RUND412_000967 [Rhizina undulata]